MRLDFVNPWLLSSIMWIKPYGLRLSPQRHRVHRVRTETKKNIIKFQDLKISLMHFSCLRVVAVRKPVVIIIISIIPA
jgi:hypothetical protein